MEAIICIHYSVNHCVKYKHHKKIMFSFSVSLLREFDPGYIKEFDSSRPSVPAPPSPPPLSSLSPQQQTPTSSHHSRPSSAGGVQLRIKNRLRAINCDDNSDVVLGLWMMVYFLLLQTAKIQSKSVRNGFTLCDNYER